MLDISCFVLQLCRVGVEVLDVTNKARPCAASNSPSAAAPGVQSWLSKWLSRKLKGGGASRDSWMRAPVHIPALDAKSPQKQNTCSCHAGSHT